jgi:hypothetical protein
MTNKEFRILALIDNGDRRELSLNQQARGISAICHDAGYPRETALTWNT